MKKLLILTVAGLCATFSLTAQDTKPTTKPTSKPAAEQQWTTVAAYPLDGCVVSDRELSPEKTKTFEIDGRTYKTCCSRCQAKVEKAPAPFAEKLDEAVVNAQLASYPLTTCVVSNKDLGAKSKNIVLNGTLVRVCCGRCAGKAPKMADELVAKVEAATYAKQVASYTHETCPVSGEKIDVDEATDVLYAGNLVRLCCDDCIDTFKSKPTTYMAKLTGDEKKDAGAPSDGKESASCCDDGAGTCCSTKKK